MADDGALQTSRRIADLLSERHDALLDVWIKERLESGEFRDELISVVVKK